MKEQTKENSEKEALIIREIMGLTQKLDIEYLEKALADMKSNHSFRDSAAILNPSPFTHQEKQDLEAAKNKQLELILNLAKNIKEIKQKTIELQKRRLELGNMNRIFGM